MAFGTILRDSFRRFIDSPVLFGMLLAEMVLVWVLAILFFIVDGAVAFGMNADALRLVDPANIEAAISAMLNAPTIAVMGVLVVFQLLVLLLLDSLFKAGLYGMAKNAVLDGTTTIREFWPEAKRFWPPMLRFLLIRYLLLALLFIPSIILLYRLAITPVGMVGETLVVSAIIGIVLFLLGWLAISLLFLYGEAAIVLDDETASGAIRSSARALRERPGLAIVLLLTILLMLVAIGLLERVIAIPIEANIVPSPDGGLPSGGWVVARNILGLLSNLAVLSVTVIGMLLSVLAYREIRGPRKKSLDEPTPRVKKPSARPRRG